MAGDGPSRITDRIIDAFRERETAGVVELLAPPPRLRQGDRVRVLHGPFADHVGLYRGMAGPERTSILLQLLGGQQRVELPAHDIAPAGVRAPCSKRSAGFAFRL